MRHKELISLQIGDVDFKAETIRIRAETVKTGKERIIPIHPELKPILIKRVQLRRVNGLNLLFPNLKGKQYRVGSLAHALKNLIYKLNFDKPNELDVQTFKVTFTTRLAQGGVPIGTVQKLLGHATASQTLSVYVKANQEDTKLAIDALSYGTLG